MIPRRWHILGALLCLLLTQDLRARQTQTHSVSVLVSATDRFGRIVSNLRKEDIRIFEDGVQRPIVAISKADSLPISIEVLIDVSGSVRRQIGTQAPLITEFLNLVIRTGKDSASVSAFAKKSVRQQDFTDDLSSLRTAVNAVTNAATTTETNTQTKLYDALADATVHLTDSKGRRAILLVTDGWDNSSRLSHKSTIDLLQKTGVAVYSVSRRLVDTNTVRLLAENSGGIAYTSGNDQDIDRDLREMARQIASQCLLEFQPAARKQPGKFRKLRIETTRPELKGMRFQFARRYFSGS
jgi:Ca-activated chloride channel family protein